MGALFSSPSTPTISSPPVTATTTDQEADAAAERERKRALAATGRSSTVLTSGLGVTDQAPLEKKTLLGG
jgi:hypothetical protein